MQGLLPTEQLLPVYPATQSQRKSFTSSAQFSPLWQGRSAQSSMCEFQKRDVDRHMHNCYNEPITVLSKIRRGKNDF